MTRLWSLVAAGLILSCAGQKAPRPAPRELPDEETPRLILFLVIDQARADYFERFRPLFRFGFDRLLEESVVFTDAHHDHATTKTAPGHATLATGTHPSRHGMIGNEWFDRETGSLTKAVEDKRYSADSSPHRLLAPTIGDWLKHAYPDSKVFAASGKDRAAILLAGKTADGVFWYDKDEGRLVTSNYYLDQEPAWFADLDRDPYPDRFFGTLWEPLPETLEAVEAFGVETIDRGLLHSQFPHPVGGATTLPEEDFYEAFYDESPFTDRYLLELAEVLIDAEQLGRDVFPDFLGISFSAVDKIGHRYGPNSPELLDTLLRLDRVVGELLDFVDQRVGLEHVIVSVSSDHGIPPIPGYRSPGDLDSRRFDSGQIACFQGLDRSLTTEFGEAEWFLGDFILDPVAAREKGVARAVLESSIQRHVESCDGVVRAWTRSELLAGNPDADPILGMFINSYHPDRSPDVVVQLEPGIFTSIQLETSHGAPYPYDTHVPWLLRLPSGVGATIGARVRTVDVAPTIAELIGLDGGAETDGDDLSHLFRGLAPPVEQSAQIYKEEVK